MSIVSRSAPIAALTVLVFRNIARSHCPPNAALQTRVALHASSASACSASEEHTDDLQQRSATDQTKAGSIKYQRLLPETVRYGLPLFGWCRLLPRFRDIHRLDSP